MLLLFTPRKIRLLPLSIPAAKARSFHINSLRREHSSTDRFQLCSSSALSILLVGKLEQGCAEAPGNYFAAAASLDNFLNVMNNKTPPAPPLSQSANKKRPALLWISSERLNNKYRITDWFNAVSFFPPQSFAWCHVSLTAYSGFCPAVPGCHWGSVPQSFRITEALWQALISTLHK